MIINRVEYLNLWCSKKYGRKERLLRMYGSKSRSFLYNITEDSMLPSTWERLHECIMKITTEDELCTQ